MAISEVEAAATVGFWTVKRVAIAAGIFLAIIVLCIVGYFVFVAPGKAASDIAAAKGGEAMAKGGVKSGQQAVQIVEGNHKEGENTDAQTRANQVVILKQPGAAVELDPAVDAAGRSAICLRKSAADLAGCVGLQQPRSP